LTALLQTEVYVKKLRLLIPSQISNQLDITYTVFHKKGPLFVFFIIHSNDDQFTQNFCQLY